MHKIRGRTSKNAQNPTRNFQKCTKSQEKLPNMHKISRGSCAFLEVPNGMFCILEVLHVIFCIFGRNSQDVVQFLKFFIGLLEVPYDAKHSIRNFQKCTRYFGTCLVLSVNCVHILA
jgi:hypothetical protein